MIGAFLVNGAKTLFTAHFAEYWLFLLGAMFVLVTLYLPDGVTGLWNRLRERRVRPAPSAPEPVSSPVVAGRSGGEA
ncbi:hypothetical protein D3C72_2206140 [compost metagenome]